MAFEIGASYECEFTAISVNFLQRGGSTQFDKTICIGLEKQTGGQSVLKLDIEDFFASVEYLLTHAHLVENDPRLQFIQRIKGMKIAKDRILPGQDMIVHSDLPGIPI